MAQEGQRAVVGDQIKAIARPPVWLGLLMTLLGYLLVILLQLRIVSKAADAPDMSCAAKNLDPLPIVLCPTMLLAVPPDEPRRAKS